MVWTIYGDASSIYQRLGHFISLFMLDLFDMSLDWDLDSMCVYIRKLKVILTYFIFSIKYRQNTHLHKNTYKILYNQD